LKIISKANGVYKTNYSFGMNIMEEIFEIRSCIKIWRMISKALDVIDMLKHRAYEYNNNNSA